MRLIYMFFLIVFLSQELASQQDQYNLKYRVIALGGLNIREFPSQISRIIGGISFLEEIEIIKTNDSLTRDTIGYNMFYNPIEDYSMPIIGNWVKIKHADLEGYVFNSYLTQISLIQENRIEKINMKYGLNFPGQQCLDNIHRNKQIKWFGLYKNGKSNEYSFKPIKVSYNIEDSDYTWLNVTGGDKGLLLMYGMNEERLMKSNITGEFHYLYQRELSLFDYNFLENIYKGTDLIIEYNKITGYTELWLKNETGEQLLNPEKYNLSSPESLIWKGDIDGDEMTDYIILYGEKSIQVILYLSSEADEGAMVKPVAIFYSGYCC